MARTVAKLLADRHSEKGIMAGIVDVIQGNTMAGMLACILQALWQAF